MNHNDLWQQVLKMTKHCHYLVSREAFVVVMNMINCCEDNEMLANLVIADPAIDSEYGIIQIVVNGLNKYAIDN